MRRALLRSCSKDSAYAPGRACSTVSTGGAPGSSSVRASSRRRRFRRLRSTALRPCRGTTRPTRGWSRRRREAVIRTSIVSVRSRFPVRAMRRSSDPRVMRTLRGKDTARSRSGAGVLAWQPHGEPLAPLLPPAREDFTSPLVGHAGAESVLLDAALVARAICGLAHDTSGKGAVAGQTRKPSPACEMGQANEGEEDEAARLWFNEREG